jgi:hypothetical protein
VKIERVHVVDAGDPLDADHPFVHRLVRQPRRADEVADRVDAGFAGAQPFVDEDMAPFDLDAGVFEPDVFDIADDPDGKDDAVGYCAGRKVKGGKIRALVRLARLKNQPSVGAPAISRLGDEWCTGRKCRIVLL